VLLDIHTRLTDQTLKNPDAAGRFRHAGESIQVVDPYNEVLHDPPPAEQLPERIAALCEFANGRTPGFFIHPVVRAIILHFWLAYDHPFVDGNGRCARALFYWSMLKQGYWLAEFMAISEIIKKAPAKYGRAFLHVETDENDLTYFVLYHLGVIRQAIAALQEYVQKKTRDLRQIEDRIRSVAQFNHRQLALLSHALRHPQANYTTLSHQNSHRIVPQTARNDLYGLARKGLLEERRTGRALRFRPAPDLERRLKDLT
jgi:Fic family protein